MSTEKDEYQLRYIHSKTNHLSAVSLVSDEDTHHEAETTARGIEAYRLAIKNEGHIF